MLTPQQIIDMRKKYNITPVQEQVSTKPVFKTAEERMQAIMNGTTPTNDKLINQNQQGKENEKNKIPSPLDYAGGILKTGWDVTKKRVGEMYNSANQARKGEISGSEAALQVAGAVAGGVGDMIGAGVSKAGELINDVSGSKAGNLLNSALNAKTNLPGGTSAAEGISNLMTKYDNWKEKHPRAAKDIESVIDIASLIPITKGATIAKDAAVAGVEQGAKTAVGKIVKEGAETVVKKGEEIAIKQVEKNMAKKAGNALKLNMQEMSKLDKRQLQYLKPKALAETEIKGKGILKKTSYQVTPEVQKLQKDFSHLLQGRTPHENIVNVVKEQNRLNALSNKIVEESNKIINKNTLVKELKDKVIKGIPNLPESAYRLATPEQIQAMSERALNGFLALVKKGDLKGINEARKLWRSRLMKESGKLSAENEVLHKAVQTFIEESLPEGSKAIYTANKINMAKLFDVKEILRAKKAATVGGKTLLQRSYGFLR